MQHWVNERTRIWRRRCTILNVQIYGVLAGGFIRSSYLGNEFEVAQARSDLFKRLAVFLLKRNATNCITTNRCFKSRSSFRLSILFSAVIKHCSLFHFWTPCFRVLSSTFGVRPHLLRTGAITTDLTLTSLFRGYQQESISSSSIATFLKQREREDR